MEDNLEKDQLAEMIRRRLKLDVKFRTCKITKTKLLVLVLVMLAYAIFLVRVALPLFSPFYLNTLKSSTSFSLSSELYDFRVLSSFIMISVGWFGAWIAMLFVDGQLGKVDPISFKPIIIIFSVLILLFTGEMFFAIYAAYK